MPNLSVKLAAGEIGMSSRRLRKMIENYHIRSPQGRAKPTGVECKAVKLEGSIYSCGYAWMVPMSEVTRLKGVKHANGRPRGG